MASTSAPHNAAVCGRFRTAASAFSSENQSFLFEIRKAFNMIKDVAVDLEKDNLSEMVKELENGVIELLTASDDISHLSAAIQSIGNSYVPDSELTDFQKLLDVEIAQSKACSSSTPENNSLLRQFREAVWNVHHPGQPMPGEELEDIVVTSTQSNFLNIKCPLTLKPLTELEDPVRSNDCKHVYENKAILQYMRSKDFRGQCPVAGCPRKLLAEKVKCDPLLLVEIEELRVSMSRQTAPTDIIEDFTERDEAEDSQ